MQTTDLATAIDFEVRYTTWVLNLTQAATLQNRTTWYAYQVKK